MDQTEGSDQTPVNSSQTHDVEKMNKDDAVPRDSNINELLEGIDSFLKSIHNQKVGGNVAYTENEKEKVAKLFNVLSVEDLYNKLKNSSEG